MAQSKAEIQKRYRENHPEKVKDQMAKQYSREKGAGFPSTKRWRHGHPDKQALCVRRSRLKKNYNLTIDDFNKLLEAQGGVCAICGGINKDSRSMCVDHDHKTNLVRSLLCRRCNMVLGLVYESQEILAAMSAYLIKFGQGCGTYLAVKIKP